MCGYQNQVLKNKKYVILMYFGLKNTLKNNRAT